MLDMVFITRELNIHEQKETEWYLPFMETSLFLWKRMAFLICTTNSIQLFALHDVYLPAIRVSSDEFILQWNHHGLQTINRCSLLALWHLEIVHTGVDNFDVGDESLFGIDPDGPVGENR